MFTKWFVLYGRLQLLLDYHFLLFHCFCISLTVATHKQVAQLSQRHRAAGWVSFDQKWKTIFCRQYRSIFNHCDV